MGEAATSQLLWRSGSLSPSSHWSSDRMSMSSSISARDAAPSRVQSTVLILTMHSDSQLPTFCIYRCQLRFCTASILAVRPASPPWLGVTLRDGVGHRRWSIKVGSVLARRCGRRRACLMRRRCRACKEKRRTVNVQYGDRSRRRKLAARSTTWVWTAEPPAQQKYGVWLAQAPSR